MSSLPTTLGPTRFLSHTSEEDLLLTLTRRNRQSLVRES